MTQALAEIVQTTTIHGTIEIAFYVITRVDLTKTLPDIYEDIEHNIIGSLLAHYSAGIEEQPRIVTLKKKAIGGVVSF